MGLLWRGCRGVGRLAWWLLRIGMLNYASARLTLALRRILRCVRRYETVMVVMSVVSAWSDAGRTWLRSG